MLDAVRDTAGFYDTNRDAEHAPLEQHQLEFDLTLRHLREYLPAHGNVLGAGAAAGRYTLELARLGYSVTAVDLSPALIERCRENLVAEGLDSRVRLVEAGARAIPAKWRRGGLLPPSQRGLPTTWQGKLIESWR